MLTKYDKAWLKPLLARAGHTFAQVLLAGIGTAKVIEEVDWKVALSMACLSALCSIVKSLAVGMPEVDV